MTRRAALAWLVLAAGCAGRPSAAPPSSPPPPTPAAHHPTIVLVHGAFGGGWGFRQVADRLTADGYRVYRPTLTGQGERVHLASPSVDLRTHIADVVNVIRFEDLHDVVLVGHSYGGMVVAGVADAVPERIARVVYLDAFLPLDGETAMREDARLQRLTPLPHIDADGTIHPTWVPATQPLPHDVPQPGRTFTQPIRLRRPPNATGLPTTYVLYVPSGLGPADAKFYFFYRRAAAFGWPVATLTSDHNAQWSHPAELAKLIESIAR